MPRAFEVYRALSVDWKDVIKGQEVQIASKENKQERTNVSTTHLTILLQI